MQIAVNDQMPVIAYIRYQSNALSHFKSAILLRLRSNCDVDSFKELVFNLNSIVIGSWMAIVWCQHIQT